MSGASEFFCNEYASERNDIRKIVLQRRIDSGEYDPDYTMEIKKEIDNLN